MKKILLILTLLSVFLSADIIGFELGNPIPNMKKVKQDTLYTPSHCDKAYNLRKLSFFDSSRICIKDGNIEEISLTKAYHDIDMLNVSVSKKEILTDFFGLMKKLEKKYGKFDKSGAKTFYKKSKSILSDIYWVNPLYDTWVNTFPKDNSISKISFVLYRWRDKDPILLSLTYQSKKTVEEIKKSDEDRFGAI